MSVSLRAFLARLRKNRAGNVLLMTAAATPAIIGAAGLGTDTVQWMLWKRQLQQAADSSALAGALAIAQGASDAEWHTVAASDLANNGDIAPTSQNFGTPTTGKFAGNPRAVHAMLTFKKQLPFSGMILDGAPTIAASATAAVLSNGSNCVLSLAESGTGVNADLTGGSVTMGCGAAANSRSEQALLTSTSFHATPLSAVGGISGTPSAGTDVYPYSVAQEDPFADLSAPAIPATCNSQLKKAGTYGPGCYSQAKLAGGDTAVLTSGTYIFTNGFELVGGSTLKTAPDAEVTLIVTGGEIKIAGDASIQLTAPSSGPYEGIIIYNTTEGASTITGSSGSYLEGAIYMPHQTVTFTGNAGIDSNCMQIVGERVSFEGNTTISNTCPAGSGAHAFSGTVVRLVG
jgi:Flp pilus assembly protein TadG